jgi:hypothetical protein
MFIASNSLEIFDYKVDMLNILTKFGSAVFLKTERLLTNSNYGNVDTVRVEVGAGKVLLKFGRSAHHKLLSSEL